MSNCSLSVLSTKKTIYSKLNNNIIKPGEGNPSDLKSKYKSLIEKSGRIRPDTANVYKQ